MTRKPEVVCSYYDQRRGQRMRIVHVPEAWYCKGKRRSHLVIEEHHRDSVGNDSWRPAFRAYPGADINFDAEDDRPRQIRLALAATVDLLRRKRSRARRR